MRLARKLFLLAAMALAALAMTAGTANAQVEVIDEDDNEHCSAVILPHEHEAEGGCHVEFLSTGEIPLFANVPGVGVVELSNCEVHIEARIGEDGEGYVTKADLRPHPSPSFPCTRTPCDEADGGVPESHPELLWPIHLEEAAGEESLEATFCLRPLSSAEGQGNTPCTVHLEVADLGNHELEIGHPDIESHCEPGLPFDVWIENAHFRYEPDTEEERIEVVH